MQSVHNLFVGGFRLDVTPPAGSEPVVGDRVVVIPYVSGTPLLDAFLSNEFFDFI
jgi:hypothetical protein